MKLNFRTVMFGLILIGLGAFVVNLLREEAVPVDLDVVLKGDIVIRVADDGRTQVREIYTVSSPLNARVLRIEPDVGDAVEAGRTVLVRLLPSTSALLDRRTEEEAMAAIEAAQAAVQLAISEVARARAEEDFAIAELRRVRDLVERNVTSKVRLEQAELALKTAQAARKAAQAAVQVRKADLATAKAMMIDPLSEEDSGGRVIELTAPVSGQVLSVPDSSEKTVTTGAPLIEVGNPRDLEVIVDLLSTEAVKVMAGDPAVISDWGGEPLRARVERVEPVGFTKFSALGVEEQRVNVILVPDGDLSEWSQLGHGFRVEAAIEIDRFRDVLSVPISALFRQDKDWAVFRVDKEHAFRQIVRLGARSGGRAIVTDGLKEGDQVVIFPSADLNDGGLIVERRDLM